jgi:hypothetical protein
MLQDMNIYQRNKAIDSIVCGLSNGKTLEEIIIDILREEKERHDSIDLNGYDYRNIFVFHKRLIDSQNRNNLFDLATEIDLLD